MRIDYSESSLIVTFVIIDSSQIHNARIAIYVQTNRVYIKKFI